MLIVPISPSQVIQCHTPFAALVDGPEQLRHKHVLVIDGGPNGEAPRKIAHIYGFQNVFTPGDILAAYPGIWPFSHRYGSSKARPFPKECKIAAIFVYSNPLDWGPVLQIMIDLLLSCNGEVGTRSLKNGNSSLPSHGYLQDGQPKVYIANSVMRWPAEYYLPRFGQGSLRAVLEGLWKTYIGHDVELGIVGYGKPAPLSFAYAENALEKRRKEMLSLNDN